MTLILASISPRRRNLLESLEVRFDVIPSRVAERAPAPGETAHAYALALAREKADDVARRFTDRVVLAADTVVSIDGVILGKPEDAADAMRMLMLLRRRRHTVTTAVVSRCGRDEHEGVVESHVTMRDFSRAEAHRYIDTGEPMDKAGAYAVQGLGGALVSAVEGCYDAVVGLPLCLTVRLLAACGVGSSLPAHSGCAACP